VRYGPSTINLVVGFYSKVVVKVMVNHYYSSFLSAQKNVSYSLRLANKTKRRGRLVQVLVN